MKLKAEVYAEQKIYTTRETNIERRIIYLYMLQFLITVENMHMKSNLVMPASK